ncbi:MAG: sulfatase-like hydrolase/transferase, partial [Firmicutes bacterium]|nr:sulfatase-like hydrolase/transferase [Bacillota bacterium]
ETAEITGNFDPALLYTSLFIIIAFVVAFIISLYKFRIGWMDTKRRFAALGITVAAALILNAAVFANDNVYNSFKVEGNEFFRLNHYKHKGWLYSYVHDFSKDPTDDPEEYNRDYYEYMELEFEKADYTNTERPHIFVVMGEAFSDLSENENLDFSKHVDPLEHFKSVAEEDSAISGHLIASTFGGGTSCSEFDFLTALVNRYVSPSQAPYSLVKGEITAMPGLLREQGYHTMATHGGDSWFFNRINVYKWLGFNDLYFFEDEFTIDDITAAYVSDAASVRVMLEKFEEHTAVSEDPVFSWMITIENHGPYEEKFGPAGSNSFSTDIDLTPMEKNLLSNYFYGVHQADESLNTLVEYFRNSDEPVVLLYFGDHLPGFSDGMTILEKMEYNMGFSGGPEQALNLYKTPFLIWENDAAKEIVDIKENYAKTGLLEHTTISANYLGAIFLKLCGLSGLDPAFDYAAEAALELPVASYDNYMRKDGTYTTVLNPEEQAVMDKIEGWTYYRIFDKPQPLTHIPVTKPAEEPETQSPPATEPPTEEATETESASETESISETENASETESETRETAESEPGTEELSETEEISGTAEASEATSEAAEQTEAESTAEPSAEPESGNQSENQSENVSEAESASESDAHPVTESEAEAETKAEAETEEKAEEISLAEPETMEI